MKKWRFTIHPAGVLCLLAAVLFLPGQRLAAAAMAILLHEGAHLLAMRLCGVQRLHVEWTPLGFVAQAGELPLLPWGKRLWIAAAGLLVSGAAALVHLPFAARFRFAYEGLMANVSVLLINSLPMLPLDGSRILLALAAGAGWEKPLEKGLLIFSYATAIGLCALAMYSAFAGVLQPSLLLLGPYLAYAARQSVQESSADQIRRMEWRCRRQAGKLYPAQVWVSVGKAENTAVLHAIRQCPEERYLLIHQIDPASGSLQSVQSEKQVMNLFMKEQ